MSIAIRKLQGIGLIMLVTFCFLIAYPISLKVSATRAELQKVEQEIADTRKRNRMLEGDIAVLANVRQLDRWNREYLGYVAPTPEQYLPGERALANLDRLRPPADTAPEAPVLMALRDDVAPDRQQMLSRTANGEDDAERNGGLSISDAAPRRIALADRATVSDRALRDIARTIPVAAVGGPR
jgi:hypothetical protein